MKIIKPPKFKGLKPISTKEGQKIYANYFSQTVQAGFPSPADDFVEDKLSLDERFIGDHTTTFFVEVEGYSMFPTLLPNDILVIKTDRELKHNDLAIFSINNSDYTVKRFDKDNESLIADNKEHSNVKIGEDDVLICLGVVYPIIRLTTDVFSYNEK